MPEYSYPFDGGSGAILTEDDWSDLAKNWQDDGVITQSVTNRTALRVEQDSEIPNVVTVSAGSAFLQGFMYRNTETLELSFTTNDSGNPRIDCVVLRLNRNTNVIQALVVEGTPAASPAPPALNTTYPIYEMSLATLTVAAGQSIGTVEMTRSATSRYIRVSESTSGHPVGSIVYNPLLDELYMANAVGSVEPIGGSSGGGSSSIVAAYRTTESAVLTGGAQVDDPVLTIPIAEDGVWRVSGTVFYQSNTASATATFAMRTQSANNWRISYQYHPATANLAHMVQTSLGGGPTIGTPSSSPWYFVNFEAIADFPSGVDCWVFTAAHSGTSQWVLGRGSYIRAERLGD